MSEIKTLNGYSLADTKAREDIASLTKEMAALKMDTLVTKTGVVVSINAKDGATLNIDADVDAMTTLVHHGKNFIPAMTSSGTISGIVYTPNSDGTVKLEGTATETAYIDVVKHTAPLYLPAGSYALSAELPNMNVYFSLAKSGESASIGIARYDNNKRFSFTLDEASYVYGFFGVTAGASINTNVWVQIEQCAETPSWSAYEQHVKHEIGVTFPTMIDALSGTNILYTYSGDELLVSMAKSEESTLEEDIAKAVKFDSTVWGMPILALTGDVSAMSKDDSVDLAYIYNDATNQISLSGTCSVKWQGSSSIRYAKKNYTIKFDNAFEAVEGWTAQKKYCFKANYIDHSHARNVINAKLWGQIVKSRSIVPTVFANLINAGAVDGFPCIITLNGEFHGLYTFNIPKDGWMMNMGSGSQECILCAGNACDANGFKAAATLEGENDLEIEYITDENNTSWAVTSVNNLISACINSDGSDLDTTIAPMLDWQSAIDYYIFTVLVAGHDMTQKNYLLVTFDGTKWYFSAYDMDCTYGLYWDGSKWLPADNHPTFVSFANMHRAMELIKLYKKDALKARYAELRESVLSESNIATVFANFAGQIPSNVYIQDAKKWPMIPNTSTNDIAQIRDYYRMRVAFADKWIEAL